MVSVHLCLHFILKNHAKSKLDSNIVAICGLLKQIINHNRSKFGLSKLVLTGVCCKHFMYTCMHRSCTLSSVHVECVSLWSDFYLYVQNSDNILLNMNVKFSYFHKIWLINNTIIFNLIKSVSIINYYYIIIKIGKMI